MKIWLSRCVSLILAGIFISLILGAWLLNPDRNTPRIVVLGDSIIGSAVEDKTITDYMEEQLGYEVQNGAFGGTGAAYDNKDTYPADVDNHFSLVSIATSILTGDFSLQKAMIAYGDRYYYIFRQTPHYFRSRVEELETTDFSKVEYLVIQQGTNDYNDGTPIENPQDPYDKSTYAGALRSTVERFRGAYPQLKVLLVTPTWCYVIRDGQVLHGEQTDFGGGVLGDYAEACRKVGEEYNIPVLDNYTESGISAATAGRYLIDGLHMNAEGQKLLAGRMVDFIRELEEQ